MTNAAVRGVNRRSTHGISTVVMDQVPYPMVEMSTEGHVRFVNHALVDLLGYPDARTLITAPLFDVVAHPEEISALRSAIERDGAVGGLEIELIRFSGKSIWVVAAAHEVDGSDGSSWQATLVDITTRRRAEQAATDNERRYRAIFEQSPVGLWEEDFSALHGWFEGLRAAGVEDLRDHLARHPEDTKRALSLVRVVDVNAAGLLLQGVKRKSKALGSLRPLEDIRGGFTEQICCIWDGINECETEITGKAEDGRTVTHTLRMSVPSFDGQPDLSRVIVAIIDITDRVAAEQARHEAHLLFRSAFTDAPIGMVLIETSGRITDVNRALCDLAGRSAPELSGVDWREIVFPDDLDSFAADWESVATGMETVMNAEVYLVRPDETVARASIRLSAAIGNEGTQSYFIGQFVDSTDLHASNAELLRFFNSIPVALYRIGGDGRFLDANPALLNLLGYPDLQALKDAGVISLYRDPDMRLDFAVHMDEHGVVVDMEQELLHQSGEMIWVQNTAGWVRDAATNEVRFEGSLVDITDRRRTSHELEASERQYRGLFDRSPVALFSEDFSRVHEWIERLRSTGVTDIRSHLQAHPDAIFEASRYIDVLDVNQAAVDLLEAESAAQLMSSGVVPKRSSSRHALTEQVIALAEGRTQLRLEHRRRTLKGKPIETTLMWLFSPGEDRASAYRVLVAMVDMTERREADRQLADLGRTKDALIASIAHELRTPITAVVGFAEELRDTWDDIASASGKEFIDEIAVQSVEVSEIVEDLLVAAQLKVGRLSSIPSSVDLLAQVHRIIEHFNTMGYTEITVSGDSAMAWVDEARTRQIVRNLVANALVHGGSKIEITTSPEGATATVTVRDDGDGMDPIDVEKAFECYQRLHDHPSQPASIGLGLHISREIARSMGGDLTYGRLDGWTAFALTVPTSESVPLSHVNGRTTP